MSAGLIGVSAIFSASHHDPVRKELHGHSYRATAWWRADPPRDAMVLQAALDRLVGAQLDHQTLPAELSRAEAMAVMIKSLLPECVAVDIARPLEGLFFEDARP